MRLGSCFACGVFPFLVPHGLWSRLDCIAHHILSTTRRPFRDGGGPLAASISESVLPKLARAFAVCSLPSRLSFCATRRSKDCQELVTPVCLPTKEARVLHSDPPRRPKRLGSRSHLPHAASDRLRNSAVPSSVAFAASCAPCIIFWPSIFWPSSSTCVCRLTKSV